MNSTTNPLKIGWESVKANALPMVLLWALAAATVLGYYFVPGVASAFEPLKRWQTESGWIAAVLNRIVFCGFLPGVFLLTVKSIRPRKVWTTIAAYSLWSGMWGVLCDVFCTVQAEWFGSGNDFATVCCKTLVDQFVWTVFFSTPLNAVFFFFTAKDFSVVRARREWPKRFIADACLPMLVADWFVWLPTMFVVYVFPLPLQIQLIGFAGAYWMLVGLGVGRQNGRSEEGGA